MGREVLTVTDHPGLLVGTHQIARANNLTRKLLPGSRGLMA